MNLGMPRQAGLNALLLVAFALAATPEAGQADARRADADALRKETSANPTRADHRGRPDGAQRSLSVPGQVLIQLTAAAHAGAPYREDLGRQGRTGLAELDAALVSIGAYRVDPALQFPPVGNSEAGQELRRYYLVSYAGSSPPTAAAAVLAGSPQVQVAEPNGIITAAGIPDDPLFPDQWAHRNTGQAVAYDGSLVGDVDCDTDTDLAWDITTGSSNIIIAIIDTGVDRGHPEFAGRLTAGYDFVNHDTDPTDDCGHGTCCAGIAAAAGSNGQGVAGVNWGARIMPVKTLDQNGAGTFTDGADGIIWAADHGARILSLSVCGSLPSDLVEDAVAYAHGQGCALFCASGNYNQAHLEYPAAYTTYTMAVGALSPCNERKNPDSCDGEDWWGSNYVGVSFLTPGVRIHTTDIRGAGGYDPGDYYSEFNGTSAATPQAAGIGALVLGLNPSLTPNALENILVRCAEDLGAHGPDPETGSGRLNAHLAVLSAFSLPVYVDTANIWAESGTLHEPYDTLAEGVAAVAAGGTVVVFAGVCPEAMTLTKAMTIIAKDGVATIGP